MGKKRKAQLWHKVSPKTKKKNHLTFTIFRSKGQKLKSLSVLYEYKQKNILDVKLCCYWGNDILMRCSKFSMKPVVPTAAKALTILKSTITLILKRQDLWAERSAWEELLKSFFLLLLSRLQRLKITHELHVTFVCLIFEYTENPTGEPDVYICVDGTILFTPTS